MKRIFKRFKIEGIRSYELELEISDKGFTLWKVEKTGKRWILDGSLITQDGSISVGETDPDNYSFNKCHNEGSTRIYQLAPEKKFGIIQCCRDMRTIIDNKDIKIDLVDKHSYTFNDIVIGYCPFCGKKIRNYK